MRGPKVRKWRSRQLRLPVIIEHVAVQHSRESGDRGYGAFRIPVAFGVPSSNAGVEDGSVKSKKQLDLVIELIVIALSNKLCELIPEDAKCY